MVDFKIEPSVMASQAKNMRSLGQEINTQLTTAYQSIENMHSVWYGKRYGELVVAFNNIIPSINSLLQVVVKTIPSQLETIANNYSQFDEGVNVTTVDTTEPQKIVERNVPSDAGMAFDLAAVSDIQKSVVTNLENAKEKMNEIETTYGPVASSWGGEAAEAFLGQFKTLKAQIVDSFENIKVQFSKLMDQAQEDAQHTEGANTVS